VNGKTSDEEAIFLLAPEQNMRGRKHKICSSYEKSNILLAKNDNIQSFVASFVETKFWVFLQKINRFDSFCTLNKVLISWLFQCVN
jgi:hypothetical protein